MGVLSPVAGVGEGASPSKMVRDFLGFAVGEGDAAGVGAGVTGVPTKMRWKSEGFFGFGVAEGLAEGVGVAAARRRGRGVAVSSVEVSVVVVGAGVDAAGFGFGSGVGVTT